MERAILFTSPAVGEPPIGDQYEALVKLAEARGFAWWWRAEFTDPIPGRFMVQPRNLRNLPDGIDYVLFTENGEPVAFPVR